MVISYGSNPFFDGSKTPRFNLERHGVHSGHVQTRLRDPFCIVKKGRAMCQNGYTKEVAKPGGVPVLVAVRAKPNRNASSLLDREFFVSFLDALNQAEHAGKFNFTTQFPYYREASCVVMSSSLVMVWSRLDNEEAVDGDDVGLYVDYFSWKIFHIVSGEITFLVFE